MSMQYSRLSARMLAQTATVVLVAALAAACSGGVERFEDPIFTGNTANQRSMLGGKPVSQPTFDAIAAGPMKNGKVERAELPPASGASERISTGSIPSRSKPSTPSQTYSSVPVPRSEPRVATLPAPEAASSSAVTGEAPRSVRGWSTAGATQVSARAGDTVNSVSRRFGIPPHVLADINGVSADATFPAGRRVTIPTYVYGSGTTKTAASQPVRLPPSGGAPSVTGSIPSSSVAAAPKPHAKPGVRVASLSTPQGTARPTMSDAPVPGAAAHPKRKPTVSSARPPAASTPKTEQVARVETAPERPLGVEKQRETSGDRRFRWPAKGRIISDFGTKPGGTRNDGINLALPEGADIKAVEDGTVIYSGNELKGYGNLVLVRHDDGWVSAYAHASELLVKRGETVRRGQTVAKVGATGSVTQPQLHFELRKGNKPVDPMQYLASL
ncbi:peptidoglycan DD-metalloendopeptidase family protein [Stappia sp.]|jgi:murein DD-endopeptidase MepM/ murein hydrolase activator NlpD|uniref:peptidoglycan DD-metalloendopeptidase family protein n=1 Tax=Stappia sp. TaxID=1870903 RepID=UPI003A98FE62